MRISVPFTRWTITFSAEHRPPNLKGSRGHQNDLDDVPDTAKPLLPKIFRRQYRVRDLLVLIAAVALAFGAVFALEWVDQVHNYWRAARMEQALLRRIASKEQAGLDTTNDRKLAAWSVQEKLDYAKRSGIAPLIGQ